MSPGFGNDYSGAHPDIPTGSRHTRAIAVAGIELSRNLPLTEVFRLILDLSMEAVDAQRGLVLLIESERMLVQSANGEDFPISIAVRDRVICKKSSVLVPDTSKDSVLFTQENIVGPRVQTLMAVPLLVSGSVVGLIYLDSLLGAGQFTADDLKLLTVMANYASLGVERARRAKTEADERLREDERNEAAAIQRQFLPAAPPMVPHVDLAAYNAPCRTVGGDYYDFITHPESVAVALGDVSGKGMPAALMMMGLQARVQALTGKPQGPAKLVTQVNKFTGYNCPSNQFITFFFCTLNPSSGDLAYCNAGHNPPMLTRKSGAIVLLEGGGPVIGVLKNYKYQEFRTVMEPSDVLVIYSDGVTEATDSRGDEYGEERLQTILKESRTGSADEILDAINAHLDVFRAGTPARDDITLVVVKRL